MIVNVPHLADSKVFCCAGSTVITVAHDGQVSTSTLVEQDDGGFGLARVFADIPDLIVGLLSTATVMRAAALRHIRSDDGALTDAILAAGPGFVAALGLCGISGDLVLLGAARTPDTGGRQFVPMSVAAGETRQSKPYIALPWGPGAVVLSPFNDSYLAGLQDTTRADAPWRFASQRKNTLEIQYVFAAGDAIVGAALDGSIALWDSDSGALLRELGVLFPGSSLSAVVAVSAAHRLILMSSAGGLKTLQTVGPVQYQIERTLRLTAAKNFPGSHVSATAAGDTFSDDGYVISVLDASLITDQSRILVVTPLGVGVFCSATMEWMLVCLFDAAVCRASASASGTVAAEYCLDDSGSLLVLGPSLHDDDEEGLLAPSSSGGCTPSDVPSFLQGSPLPRDWLEPLPLRRTSSALVKEGKPVTFGHRIRSSGYTSAPPWSVQQRVKGGVTKNKSKQSHHGVDHNNNDRRSVSPQYDCSGPVIATELVKTSVLLDSLNTHTAAVTGIAFAARGTVAVTSSVDTTCFAMKQPPAHFKADGWCLKGHKAPVLCCDAWSGPRAEVTEVVYASGSSDGAVKVWRPTKRPGPALSKTYEGKEIRGVRFYADGTLLLVAAGSALSVLRYALDLQVSDLDRQKNDSRALEVLQVPSGAQSVHSVDCIGYSQTSKVVIGTSAKCVCIVDIGAGKIVSTVADAHTRPVHTVCAFGSSAHATVEAPCHDVIVSAGFDGCVKLWDVRTASRAPIRTFASHVNNSLKIGLATSPCARYIAVGSEDRAVYVVDVRNGLALSRAAMPDVPGAARYNPLQPRLLVGLNSGALRLLGPSE